MKVSGWVASPGSTEPVTEIAEAAIMRPDEQRARVAHEQSGRVEVQRQQSEARADERSP